jgi:hypothetical protein
MKSEIVKKIKNCRYLVTYKSKPSRFGEPGPKPIPFLADFFQNQKNPFLAKFCIKKKHCMAPLNSKYNW